MNTTTPGTSVPDRSPRPGPEPAQPQRSKSYGGWVALVVVYVFWGGTYLGIRVGVETVPPLMLAGGRYLLAGLILFLIALRNGPPELRAADRPTRSAWIACGIVGLLLLLGGNGLVTVGERSVPSGFASLLVATVPLWVLVMDSALARQWLRWVAPGGPAGRPG